jgi:Fic family protein
LTFNPEQPYDDLPFLPPAKEKIETITILKQESKANAALAELKGIASIIPNQSILINAIVLQEAKDSSAIENIITTQDKLYKAMLLNNNSTDHSSKEVLRYREALFNGYDSIKSQSFLRVQDIISIKSEIVENTSGIRSTPGTVLKNDKTGEIVYTPPQSIIALNNLMNNFVEYFNGDETDEISPLIKLSIMHYQFESIHPFYDGNGRTGRILNILYLILKGLLDIPILYLSSYIIDNKNEYYRLLQEVTHKDVWEEWIFFILKGIEHTSRETIIKIQKIKTLLEEIIIFVKENTKIYTKELVELLFEHPYSKIEFLVNKLGVERKTASRYLKELESINILKSEKIGREIFYINTKLIELLKL